MLIFAIIVFYVIMGTIGSFLAGLSDTKNEYANSLSFVWFGFFFWWMDIARNAHVSGILVRRYITRK